MGYTHYWKVTKPFDKMQWAKIADDARKLIAASPVKIAFEEGDEAPALVDEKTIRFNAFGEAEAHETFMLEIGEADFEFCKTAEKAYDVVVCGILAVAKEYAPETIRVSSDGNAEDWARPLAFASKVLGREIKFPVKKGEE